jgi:Trk K+ transport system NAD-binding subunit
MGIVRRGDIIQAYNLALTRRAEAQRIQPSKKAEFSEEAEFLDLYLYSGDKVIGKTVREVAPQFPPDSVLISIHRDGKLVVPHGDTVFHSGDHITAFVRNKDVEDFLSHFRGKSDGEGEEIVEVFLQKGDLVAGKTVQQVASQFPPDSVLVSIRRNGKLIVPHGSTVFQPGDHITAFVRTTDAEKLFHCLHG